MERAQCSIEEDVEGIRVACEELLAYINNVGKVDPEDLRNCALFAHLGQPEIVTSEMAVERAKHTFRCLLGLYSVDQ